PFVPTGERFEGGEGVARPADGRHQRPQGGPEIRPRIRTVRRRRGQRLETVEAPGIEEVPEQARGVGRDELAPGPRPPPPEAAGPEPPPLEAGGRGRDEAGPAPLPHARRRGGGVEALQPRRETSQEPPSGARVRPRRPRLGAAPRVGAGSPRAEEGDGAAAPR